MNDKYLLFLGETFYPSGGWDDLIGFYESWHEVREYIEEIDPYCMWFHVVFAGKIIARGKEKIDDLGNSNWEIE